MTSITRDKVMKIDELEVRRKHIRDKEVKLQAELGDLLLIGEKVLTEERRQGYRNRDADLSITRSLTALEEQITKIDQERGALLSDFHGLNSSAQLRSSGLSVVTDDLRLYRDKILQNTAKLNYLKDRFSAHVDDVIPHEPGHVEEG